MLLRSCSIILLLVTTACDPEIDPRTYFCGENMLCPPEQACDQPSYTCDRESAARDFFCPEDSEMFEPDNDENAARNLGEIDCGQTLVTDVIGCLQDTDEDWFAFASNKECPGANPRVEWRLTHPIAFAGVTLTAYKDGTAVASSDRCNSGPVPSGRRAVCLEVPVSNGDNVTVKAALSSDGNCSGDCTFSEYTLVATQISL